jgi:D-galactarolactone cycloisomerase
LAGGLTECKKIADLAYAFGVECTPHGYASAVGTAAALHLAAALPFQPSPARPDALPFEYAPEPFNRIGDLLVRPLEVAGGAIRVPLDRPGLGVEIDRAALKRRLAA